MDRRSRIGILFAGCVGLFAQQNADPDSLKARRLYYSDNSPEVVFKATTVAPKPRPPGPTPKGPEPSKAQRIEKIQQALRDASKTAELKPGVNLGVRCNIVKVAMKTNVRTEVPPETVFHQGDCAGIRIQPNRGGYLYVFNQGSSGVWRALMPSPETADETSVIRPFATLD